MTVTVKKLGGSVAVVIPKAMAREMELSEGWKLEISSDADAIVMRKQGRRRRPRRPIEQIAATISPAAYRRLRKELADPTPVGR